MSYYNQGGGGGGYNNYGGQHQQQQQRPPPPNNNAYPQQPQQGGGGFQQGYGDPNAWQQQQQSYGQQQQQQPSQYPPQPQQQQQQQQPAFWNPAAAATMAAMAANLTGSGSSSNEAAMLGLAEAAGKTFLQSSSARMIPGLESAMGALRCYFAVDNRYVLYKMKRVLFPFTCKQWKRQVGFAESQFRECGVCLSHAPTRGRKKWRDDEQVCAYRSRVRSPFVRLHRSVSIINTAKGSRSDI
jgi:YIF1